MQTQKIQDLSWLDLLKYLRYFYGLFSIHFWEILQQVCVGIYFAFVLYFIVIILNNISPSCFKRHLLYILMCKAPACEAAAALILIAEC